MTGGSVDALRRGADAYERGDAESARAAFEEAVTHAPTGEALEGLARAVHLAGDYAGSAELHERAYAAYRAEGDLLAAARAARTVAWFRGFVYGEWAVFGGWMERATALLEQADEETHEYGWVLLAAARSGSDLETQRQQLLETAAIGRKYGDADLEAEAISFLGVMLARSGFAAEGVPHMDHALATVCSGEVTDLSVVEGIWCGLLSTCESTHDVPRAEQWLRAAEAFMRRRNYVAIGGYCRAHYGGILIAAGRWQEAEAELETAASVFAPSHVRIHGNIRARLADLRILQGRLEEAAALLRGLEDHEDAVRPRTMLHLARNEPELAQYVLEGTLAPGDLNDGVEGPLLALLVDALLATGQVGEAGRAAEHMAELGRNQAGHYLKAIAALASGKVCVARGSGDARACLNEALLLFAQAGMPVELARTRLELAKALRDDNRAAAVTEASAALDAFERLAATREADETAALLRTLGAPARTGPKGREGLTKRESEVLDLLGHGLTNAEIGDRLFISPKTVEHHVGKVLAKLGHRSRTEAAAHAVRTPERSGEK